MTRKIRKRQKKMKKMKKKMRKKQHPVYLAGMPECGCVVSPLRGDERAQ